MTDRILRPAFTLDHMRGCACALVLSLSSTKNRTPDKSEIMNANTKIIIVGGQSNGLHMLTGLARQLRAASVDGAPITVIECATVEEASRHLTSNGGENEPDGCFLVFPTRGMAGKRVMRPFAPGFGNIPISTLKGFTWGLLVSPERAAKFTGFASNASSQIAAWMLAGSKADGGGGIAVAAQEHVTVFPWGPALSKKKKPRQGPGREDHCFSLPGYAPSRVFRGRRRHFKSDACS